MKSNPLLEELRLFLTAVMFYTRIPVPKSLPFSEDYLNRSTRYFPAIGWIVGGVVVLAYLIANYFWPPLIAVILALALCILLTGAFHEDGFADVCDGFGGGINPQRTLDIMKDSRVGTYAVVGLVLLFGLKIATLASLGQIQVWAVVIAIWYAHVLSRWCVVTIIFRDTYARADLTSKVKPIGRKISWSGMVAATIWLLPALALVWWWNPWWLLAVPVAFAARLLLARWFRRRLGGYTGDCLGAAQQIIEVLTYLVVLGATRGAG